MLAHGELAGDGPDANPNQNPNPSPSPNQEMEGLDEGEVWRHLRIKFNNFASWKELPDDALAPVPP